MKTVFLPLVSGPATAPTLRIGTMNLGLDETVRAASVAGDIARQYSLDVFAMQEVYRHEKDTRTPDLMASLRAGLAGYHLHEGPPGTWMINVTASRYPIVAKSTERIEERHLLMTTVKTPGGDLIIFNWHAKRDGGGQKNACRYNRQALTFIRARARGKPFVLVGDLNATAARLWGECNAGAETLLCRNPDTYPAADFWAGLWGIEVVSVEDAGNVHALQDAHALTVATVRLGESQAK